MEIPSSQILSIIQQFLKENNLTESLITLQKESKVSFISSDFIDKFEIGDYLSCLREITTTNVHPKLLQELYTFIIQEWIEQKHIQGARMLLTQTEPMILLREQDPTQYLDLESSLTRAPTPTTELEKSIKSLRKQIPQIPPNRLITLLGQALKHQISTGQLNPNEPIDLYTCQIPISRREFDQSIAKVYKTINFTKSSLPECCGFSPDGKYFVVGLMDGFVEVYNHLSGKLRTDLLYQGQGENMLMDSACLCLSISEDSSRLVTGGQDGSVYVWELITGVLIKSMTCHTEGVCFVKFNKAGTAVLTGSFDFTVKIHGMKTGKALKVFRSHTSFVNTGIYSPDESLVITGSSDGTVKLFNTQTTECLSTIKLSEGALKGLNLRPVHTILKVDDGYLVSNQSGWVYFIDLNGKLIKSFEILKKGIAQFIAACASASGQFVYLLTDRKIYCVSTASGDIISETDAGSNEVISATHHPFANVLAVCDDGAKVNLFKP